MQLIQFNIYFNHHLHIFVLNYIIYIICACAWKIIKFVAYVPCVRTQHNTAFFITRWASSWTSQSAWPHVHYSSTRGRTWQVTC